MNLFRPARPPQKRWAWLCVLAGCALISVSAWLLSAGAKWARAQDPAAPPQSASAPPNPLAQAPQQAVAMSRDAGAAQPRKQIDSAATSAPAPNSDVGSNAANDSQKQIADQCAQLLKMATALKTEVDKTTKDTLSVAVVRKAGEIEQLARKVRSGKD